MDGKTKIAIKDVGFPIAGAIVSIFAPFVGVPLAGASGVWTLIDKWREDRINEVKKSVGDNKILGLIKRDDKSRDILNKILFNVLQESSVEKRKLYYSYIKQLHKGLHPSFDYHSKAILTINLITFEEIWMLVEFSHRYQEILKAAIEKSKKDNPQGQVSALEDRGVNPEEIMLVSPFSKMSRSIIEDAFVNLGGYSLISVKHGRWNGTFYGPITEFGKVFLDFISEKKQK